MKWTKQRKITAAIVSLAGMAFGADQLFFSGGPESANAAAEQSAATGPAATPGNKKSASASVAVLPQPGTALARRLEQAVGGGGGAVGDAFRPPASWFPHHDDPRPTAKSATSQPVVVDAGVQFKARHKLIGVMRSGPAGSKQGLAVISGPGGTMTVRVGQAIDGAVLQAVEEASVILSENGQPFAVELPRPGLSASAAAQ